MGIDKNMFPRTKTGRTPKENQMMFYAIVTAADKHNSFYEDLV